MIREKGGKVYIDVKVQPRASRKKFVCDNQTLKIWVTAPPVDNKANEAVIEFIAEIMRVKRSAVSIESGLKSKNKVVSVAGVSLEEVMERLGC